MTIEDVSRYDANSDKAKRARQPIEHSPMRLMWRKALLSRGWTQKELARRSGVNKATVCHLINGTREGKIETWELLLQAAGIELGYRIKTEQEMDHEG